MTTIGSFCKNFHCLTVVAAVLFCACLPGCVLQPAARPAPCSAACGVPAGVIPTVPGCLPPTSGPTIPGSYCFPADPGRYSDVMHPAIGQDGSPFLIPQQQLRTIITTPPAE